MTFPYPRSCKDDLILNAYENADKRVFPKMENPQDVGITSIGQIAQLVEQRTENPCVGGSIPPLATTYLLIISIFKGLRTILAIFAYCSPPPYPPTTF